jgi:hypothetical protein
MTMYKGGNKIQDAKGQSKGTKRVWDEDTRSHFTLNFN